VKGAAVDVVVAPVIASDSWEPQGFFARVASTDIIPFPLASGKGYGAAKAPAKMSRLDGIERMC
jgi:hypothetical protein